MPNCFTYACARISKVIGNQPLDILKVCGAGDLWEGHAKEFTIHKYAREGALMIWKGGFDNFGHVAVCEELIDTNIIRWSESNYGMNMFDYVKGNPNGYAGLLSWDTYIIRIYLRLKNLNQLQNLVEKY